MSSGNSIFTHIDMEDARTAIELSSSSLNVEAYAIVTLDDSNGLFVVISQDQSAVDETATLIAGV
jgi:hypothetical protein